MERPPLEQDPARRASVLQSSFDEDGRLSSMPAKLAKRLVVLDHIASGFEIGRVYPESEVDARLRAFHHDTAMLRRYLVDWDFLTRADGRYWRSGGSVDLDG